MYVAVAEPETVNLGLVVGTDGSCWSTPDPLRRRAAVREAVAAVTDRPLAAVVVTHWHFDHAFGLAAFGDLTTIAHETVRARLGSPEAAADATARVEAGDLARPSRDLVVAAGMDLGGRRVEVAHLGRGTPMGICSPSGPQCCCNNTEVTEYVVRWQLSQKSARAAQPYSSLIEISMSH